MGICFSHCVTKQIKNIKEGPADSYLLGDGPLSISTASVFEDCPFFYGIEKWHQTARDISGAMLFDPNKFLENYPFYKKDQVSNFLNFASFS